MSDLTKRLQAVKLFVMDVDGILSDGQIIYDANGVETKAFYVQDGVGLKALKEQGIVLAIITGRNSPMVARRADELGIDHVVQGRDDKFTALSALADELGLSVGECMYMGDDLPDLKAVCEAGVGVSVPNGCAETQAAADIVTTKMGGHGAVREVCEQLLKAKGVYDAFIAQYI